ncbi:hypothetical protein OsI_37107 [Oryza sativa Indica Group]|uniref:CCT domain-containing protein n=4 Tax=Oryza sativa TaxID=4530 RepID=A0A8J8Y8U6_ORYSJ|nr:hypothetical protein LOC_Os11g01100 [Oryza sativa Japonica Group]EAY81930.1 hypothetical protein OsI_37107 [Oryza sativa Indica Group]EAZ17130.1 hypothetical protein OsJ_32631 [Oryza sativa Japonica Group]
MAPVEPPLLPASSFSQAAGGKAPPMPKRRRPGTKCEAYQKYACRKRLADERARVKGRFVSSSGGNDNNAPAHELPPSLVNLSDGGAAAAIIPTRSVPEWWPEMQASLARDEMCGGAGMNLHLCDANEMEQVAAYVGVSSMDLCAYLHCSWPPV